MHGTNSAPTTQPLVWLLMGDKHGDNAQLLALGRALGWRVVTKALHYDEGYPISYRKRGCSLQGVDLARSDALLAPWPDIIIGIGQRSASVSRWIKQQTGDRALNIRLGRPRTDLRHFDLIVSTLQYGLPKSARTMLLTLPITKFDEDDRQRLIDAWHDRLASLPKPWTVVLIGGKNQRLRLDRAVASDILKTARAYHDRRGGSILMTTSPRTPTSVGRHLEHLLAETCQDLPNFMFRWVPDAPNPYVAMLSGADAVIVTNDTVSMVADAAALAKPLLVYELPQKSTFKKAKLFRPLIRAFCHWMAARRESGRQPTLLDTCYAHLTNIGVIRPPRNIAMVFRRLSRRGAIRPVHTMQAGSAVASHTMSSELNAVIARIHRLHAENSGVPLTVLQRQNFDTQELRVDLPAKS